MFLHHYWQRITIREIKNHPWFLKNLPKDLTDAAQEIERASSYALQSVGEIMKIVEEAKKQVYASRSFQGFKEDEDEEEDHKFDICVERDL